MTNISIMESIIETTMSGDNIDVIINEQTAFVYEVGEVILRNTQDHNELQNRGVNSHNQIDNHLSDTDIHIINNLIDGGLFQP